MTWVDVAGNRLTLALGGMPGYVPDRREQIRADLKLAYEKRAQINEAIAEAERALQSLDYEHDQPM